MLNSLQACRAVAALMVVFFHASGSIFYLQKYFGHKPFGPIFDFGFAGVDFFFVLSGFIMMHVHAADLGQPRALGSYLWKRFTRIYPVYWVVFATILPVYFLVPHFGVGYERDPSVIVSSIFLFPHPQSHMTLGVAWTLVYEVIFYCLFGLLILNKRVGLLVFLGWTICVLVNFGRYYPAFQLLGEWCQLACSWYESYPQSFIFSPMHLRFLAGLAVALTLKQWEIPRPRLVASAGVLIFLVTSLFEDYAGPLLPDWQAIGYTLGSAMTLAGLVQAERCGLIAAPKVLVYLGNASYAIYLIHFPALSMLAKIAKMLQLDAFIPGQVLFLLHVVGAVAISCVFHHIVEKPLHNLARRFVRRAKTLAEVKETADAVEVRKAA